MDRQEVNVISSANTASGIGAKGSQIIDIRFNTKIIYVYLYGKRSRFIQFLRSQTEWYQSV